MNYLKSLLKKESERQKNSINLIASENYAYQEVLDILGSDLTNKYAEGYPGRRYYPGCNIIDEIENFAVENCKKLFKFDSDFDHANVQPHSGSQANMAVYMAILSPGDTILSLSLSSGGHITHGLNINFSGYIYNIVNYNLDKTTGLLDFNEIESIAKKVKPKLIIAGFSSYSRSIDFESFNMIAKKVGAFLLFDIAHIAGFIATGLYPYSINSADFITGTTHKSLRGPRGGFVLCNKRFAKKIDMAVMPGIQGGPQMNSIAAKALCFELAMSHEFFEYQKQVLKNSRAFCEKFEQLGYKIVSGGTDSHMFVLDLENLNYTGKQAEEILENNNINVTRSLVPFDKNPPFIASGIRVGVYAQTTKGFKEVDFENLAVKIDKILKVKNATL